ncbi:putative thiamine pyrophosphokinase [Eremomyces bilateralis CBS 781.70]|uniref:Thiamine pyrophosphokinase n=1 Tax=Eremomyces bilateralis CBS 781.70 TaxID=1392243 RepID=A0A6G1FW66_9PEZI|nr:putative thiamine pyrophosphokinase [Eremomyces bilateralis CBS 781.70]KAF1810145.1 putative thiamine pyrophosphokinase [Eremomyces bilateralis CBS 781.70]
MMRSDLEIVKECDNFPYYEVGSADAFASAIEPLWLFYLPDDPEPHGFLIDSVVKRMPWTAKFRIDLSPRKEVHLLKPEGNDDWQAACADAIDELLDLARAENAFPHLGKKRDEQFPIIGANFDIGIERSAMSLFGIVGRGAHMTVFTRTNEGIKFWVPRRNANKSTWPNMLDQAVAGGVGRGETPFECIVREADEEAALPNELVRQNIVAAGTVTWFNISDEKAGGELGLMNPGVLYVYDLEVGEDMVFKPVDNDIQSFHLMSVDEVRHAMGSGEFKPSCAAVMIDFLIRHGFITADKEKDYVEIISRLHRKLPFRTSPGY